MPTVRVSIGDTGSPNKRRSTANSRSICARTVARDSVPVHTSGCGRMDAEPSLRVVRANLRHMGSWRLPCVDGADGDSSGHPGGAQDPCVCLPSAVTHALTKGRSQDMPAGNFLREATETTRMRFGVDSANWTTPPAPSRRLTSPTDQDPRAAMAAGGGAVRITGRDGTGFGSE